MSGLLPGVAILTGLALVGVACAGGQSTSTAGTESTGLEATELRGQVGSPQSPAGPKEAEVETVVETARTELQALGALAPSNDLPDAEMTVDFNEQANDFRSADGAILEVLATSDNGSYVIGRVGEQSVARVGLSCVENQVSDLLVTDNKGRPEQDWVPIVDQLVPSLVEVSGCQAALLGSPTDCLELPDDPAACIDGDGVGQ